MKIKQSSPLFSLSYFILFSLFFGKEETPIPFLFYRQDNLQKSTNGNHDIRISRPTEAVVPLEPRPPQQDNCAASTALEMTPLVVKNSSTNLIPRREQADTESIKNLRNCENKRWQT